MFKFLIATVIVLTFVSPSIAAAFDASAVFSVIHTAEAHPYIAMATMAAGVVRKRLRYWDLLALGIVRNRVTLRNWIRARGFPPGQLTGPNSRTWCETEVQRWLDSRPTAPKPLAELRSGKRRGRPRKPASGAEAV